MFVILSILVFKIAVKTNLVLNFLNLEPIYDNWRIFLVTDEIGHVLSRVR